MPSFAHCVSVATFPAKHGWNIVNHLEFHRFNDNGHYAKVILPVARSAETAFKMGLINQIALNDFSSTVFAAQGLLNEARTSAKIKRADIDRMISDTQESCNEMIRLLMSVDFVHGSPEAAAAICEYAHRCYSLDNGCWPLLTVGGWYIAITLNDGDTL